MAGCTTLICVPQAFYGAPYLREGFAALLAYPRLYGSLALWAVLAHALRTSDEADRRQDLSG
jgi:hypothetical protein